MVAGLTPAKKGYEHTLEALSGHGERLIEALEQMKKAIDLDTEAFNDVIAAMRMPKKTDQEKAARLEALELGYKKATSVPLNTAQTCVQVLEELHRPRVGALGRARCGGEQLAHQGPAPGGRLRDRTGPLTRRASSCRAGGAKGRKGVVGDQARPDQARDVVGEGRGRNPQLRLDLTHGEGALSRSHQQAEDPQSRGVAQLRKAPGGGLELNS